VAKRPHFAEQAAGHHKRPKIMQQNVHILLKSQLDVANVLKNPVTKHPHFTEQVAGHHKCPKNHATKRPNFAEKPAEQSQTCREKSCDKTSTCRQTAGRTSQMGPKILWQTIQISLQERVDMMSQSILGRVGIMSQVTNRPT
jgi:hypothetical protein